MSSTFYEIVSSGEAGLRHLWRAGGPPREAELVGWVFRGVNTSLAARRSPLAGAEFAKGFFADGPAVYGCNFPVAVEDGCWRIDLEHPFGFFQVYPVARSGEFRGHPAGLLLDYASGRGGEFLNRWGVVLDSRLRLTDRLARPLRDLVVVPRDVADGVYVGRAFLSTSLRVPVTTFALQRWAPMPAFERDTPPPSVRNLNLVDAP
jgi:hypothetical protein